MSTPQPADLAGNLARAARHARTGPDSKLSSIPAQQGPATMASAKPDKPPTPPRPPGRTFSRTGPWRYLLLLAGVLLTSVIAAVRAAIWEIAGHPGDGPWLASTIPSLVTVIAGAIAFMYVARQETKREEARLAAARDLARSFAKLIEATFSRTENLKGTKAVQETERRRARAHKVLTDMAPQVDAIVEATLSGDFRSWHKPDADADSNDEVGSGQAN
jgi:hypothetical protein